MSSSVKCPHKGLAFNHTRAFRKLPCLGPDMLLFLALFFGTDEPDQEQCQINLHLFAFNLTWSGLLCPNSIDDHKGRQGPVRLVSLTKTPITSVLASLMSNHTEKRGLSGQFSYKFKDWTMVDGNVRCIKEFYYRWMLKINEASRLLHSSNKSQEWALTKGFYVEVSNALVSWGKGTGCEQVSSVVSPMKSISYASQPICWSFIHTF